MKKMFGYIRVSTAKQGQGVSLTEQKHAIQGYADKHKLDIVQWFEEKETAAKRGRPIFNSMMNKLRANKADGLIIHKIDRSARNLKDWADVGELIDSGIEVHFAHESVDMSGRSGRLSADIQAVIAADYIRNLSEETKKGLYGRLKQGIYPFPAPIGYLDMGPGKLKEIEPIMGPLVKKVFELYSSGRYGLYELVNKMYALGLRNKKGKKVSRTGLSIILNSKFYIGLIEIRSSGQIYEGKHDHLIDKSLFDRVQTLLRSRKIKSVVKHNYLFRKSIRCFLCHYLLTGELQKGMVYYRCHNRKCPTKGVREDIVDCCVKRFIDSFQLKNNELKEIIKFTDKLDGDQIAKHGAELKALELQIDQFNSRLERLEIKFVDDFIDQKSFNRMKSNLLSNKCEVIERVSKLKKKIEPKSSRAKEFFEHLKTLYFTYHHGLFEEKQDILNLVTSNFAFVSKYLVLEPHSPYRELYFRSKCMSGSPQRSRLRTNGVSSCHDWLKDLPKNEQIDLSKAIIFEIGKAGPGKIHIPSNKNKNKKASLKEIVKVITSQ